MGRQRVAEISVGIFMIIGIAALIFLAFKVSGLTSYSYSNSYNIQASFENVGDLKVRAPVTIAGVKIGEITDIQLNPQTYQATVYMRIDHQEQIPIDSTANIYTEGLIGSNYISLTPGFADTYLKNGDTLERTNSAMILQNIIGQLLYSFKGGSSDKDKSSGDATNGSTEGASQ